MDFEFIQMILRPLILISILIFLVLTENWKLLLAISLLSVLSGFMGMTTFKTLYVAETLPESSLYGILELAIVDFLKSIFILLLAIFTWLRKESISIEFKSK